jgi:anti-anti-sigma factor
MGRRTARHGRRRLLEVELETHAEVAILRLRGSAGITEAQAIRVALESLVREGIPTIVVDLGDLHYMASAAVAAVAAGFCRTDSDPSRIRLAAPSSEVLDVLTRSRVSECVRIYPSVATAIQSDPSSGGPAAPGPGDRQSIPRERTGHSVCIAVHAEAEELVARVPVRKDRRGVLERLVARLFRVEPSGARVPRVA